MDQSVLTEEIRAAIGHDRPPRPLQIEPQAVARLIEAVQQRPATPLPTGAPAPIAVLALLQDERDQPEPATALPASLVAGDEWELQRPPCVGDRLRVQTRLTDAYERFGGRFGHALYLHYEWTARDEDRHVVARARRILMRYASPGSAAAMLERPLNDARSVVHHGERPGLPLVWEQAREGDALPGLDVDIGLGDIIRYLGATWNFLPIFYDADYARAQGLEGPILPGPYRLALLSRMLDEALAGQGMIRAVRCAYRRPASPGLLRCRGAVLRRYEEDGARLLDCQVWTENAHGEQSAVGVATLTFD